MPRSRNAKTSSRPYRRRRPSMTPEGRENEIIAMAYDLAEQQIRDGTVSAQVLAHFVKLGSTKERLEKEILEKQGKLLGAKTEAIEAGKRNEELYKEALDAMRIYTGNRSRTDEDL